MANSFEPTPLAARRVLPRLVIADGSLEAIKWLAVVLMTGDHVNKYLFNGTIQWMFSAGRLTLPLFGVVLAYNLARPETLARAVYQRTIWRLFVTGCIAMPVFVSLGNLVAGWWPLNVMFMLAATAGMLCCIDRGTTQGYFCAGLIFIVAGSLVEFWWPGLGLGLAVWLYCRQPSYFALALGGIACYGLCYINGNAWAMLAVPCILAASRSDLGIPRFQSFFYFYYPAHLAALWLIRIPMRKAGYLFF